MSNPHPISPASWTFYDGDARAVLAGIPDQAVNCIVTSPPYWGKRDYGIPGQYVHEPTPQGYVDTVRDPQVATERTDESR